MATSDLKVWLITGCNAGFGLVLATIAAKAGHTVVGTVRSLSKFPASLKELGVEPLEIELTASEETIASAVQSIASKHGRLDVLINNAGYAHIGTTEESTSAETESQFSVNVFGLLNFVRGVLSIMRPQRRGVILNFSSIAGIAGGEGAPLYVGTKFAVEGLSECLAAEVARFGIRVHLVEPGYFRTNFLGVQGGGSSSQSRRIEEYPDMNGAFASRHGEQNGDPERGMQRVYELVTLTGMCEAKGWEKRLRLVIGSDSYEGAKMHAEGFLKELEATREIAYSTDFPGAKQIPHFIE